MERRCNLGSSWNPKQPVVKVVVSGSWLHGEQLTFIHIHTHSYVYTYIETYWNKIVSCTLHLDLDAWRKLRSFLIDRPLYKFRVKSLAFFSFFSFFSDFSSVNKSIFHIWNVNDSIELQSFLSNSWNLSELPQFLRVSCWTSHRSVSWLLQVSKGKSYLGLSTHLRLLFFLFTFLAFLLLLFFLFLFFLLLTCFLKLESKKWTNSGYVKNVLRRSW